MRINRRIAQLYPDISRRKADKLLASNSVWLNGHVASVGDDADKGDDIAIEGYEQIATGNKVTMLLNKPKGYIVSHRQQGNNPTIYELLPSQMQHLNYAGRLDKDSRGLLLLTNDGDMLHELTHPSFNKDKVYQICTDKPIDLVDLTKINEGIYLDDGLSRLEITTAGSEPENIETVTNNIYLIVIQEGRNRQIRRTLSSLGYEVIDLLRLQFGGYKLGQLKEGEYRLLDNDLYGR